MKRNTVILINPSHNEDVDPSVAKSFGASMRDIPREDPPLSLLNLGAFIRDRGYQVEIIDTCVVDDYRDAGYYEVEWNVNSSDRQLSSGIYLYKIQAGSYTDTKKLILLK